MEGVREFAPDARWVRPETFHVTLKFIEAQGLESRYVKPFIQAPNVDRWEIKWTGVREKTDTYVIYPHREVGGRTQPVELAEVPGIARWLRRPENQKRLHARTYVAEANRRWYELWVPQRPSLFLAKFKILTRDIAPSNSFALDEEGRWCGGRTRAYASREEGQRA